MVSRRFQHALESLMSLGDPVRRRLYDVIATEGRQMSRNEVAGLAGVARPLAAYHLDRLVKDGLLLARFERQTGRTGPGAGRPAKLYFRPRSTVSVSLPARDHGLAALVLLEAEARRSQANADPLLEETAREAGKDLADSHLGAAPESSPEALRQLLSERGYEPQTGPDGAIWLRNCVFDELAEQQRNVVCGMNLALMRGMLEALP
ncbi:MAG TPA: helix-turn-helix domain-containing protein, partial [Dehalococcoidia bacterium]|nr:helix-turn-helix domain-containing protein [Dehalococcoidia bacterium]